jgi:hypothetical protein
MAASLAGYSRIRENWPTFGLPSNEAVASECFRMIWLSQLAFKDNLSFLSAYSGLTTSFSMLIPTMVARK